MSLNKVMLIGNVGKDPEVRYLDGNQPSVQGANNKVASFPLATTERYRDRAGELRENTEWHNIVAWRNSADLVEKYVRKGTQIYVEGRLRTRSWTDQTGGKRYTTEVVADNIQLLGRRSDNPAGQDGGYAPAGQGYQTTSAQNYQQAAPSQSQGYAPAPGYNPAPAAAAQGYASAPAVPDSAPGDDLPF